MRNHTAFNVVAEIEYINEDLETIHSDIGPDSGDLNAALAVSPDFRQYLHDNLDEWLDKSDGTGIFYITGDSEQFLRGPTHLDPSEEALNDRIDRLEAEVAWLKRLLRLVPLPTRVTRAPEVAGVIEGTEIEVG